MFFIQRSIQSIGSLKALYTFPPLTDLFIPNVEMVAKGDSNLGSLDCESGIL